MEKPLSTDFREDLRFSALAIAAAKDLVALPPLEIVEHFRRSPSIAKDLLDESYSKRYTPSTFIKENWERFTVGWYSKVLGYECIRHFSNLADAATNYLLVLARQGKMDTRIAGNSAEVQ